MKKKILSALLCVAMVGTMLVGCGAKDEPTTTTPETETETETEGDTPAAGDYSDIKVEVVAKGFQHDFWKAVKLGAEKAGKDLGLKNDPAATFVGPKSEQDIAEQVEQLKNAINKGPDAICLAALDTASAMDPINQAMSAGIPIVGFDSGVPDAPEGSVVANAATDNEAAGAMAADELYKLIKDKVTDPAEAVRIGVVSQEANSQSIVDRTKGFIDQIVELIGSDKCSVEGHDKYTNKVDGAKVIIDVGIPANINDAEGVTVAQKLLGQTDLIAIYGSNEFAAKSIITANENLQVLGKDKVIGIGFDSGSIQLQAVRDGILAGSVTQNPVMIGYKAVELAVKAAAGETVEDVDTGCVFYTAENMEAEDIAPCLYE